MRSMSGPTAPPEAALPEPLRGLVRETPLVDAPALGAALKLESLQRGGSFKVRGTCVALAALHARGVQRVVAASAGNHGLGLALAAAALGMHAELFVPKNAAQIKRERIATLGAVVRMEGADYDEAEAAAKARATEVGLPFVSPFDDDAVMAGNGGWLGREILKQRPSTRRIVVPVGGGGLVAGLLGAVPGAVEIIGVQPTGACAMARSLREGTAILTDPGDRTICSGLDGGVSARTFAIARDRQLRVEIVEEEAILPALAFAYRRLGQVIEPASATVIAAALGGLIPCEAETVLVVTGGNVDAALLDRAIGSG